MKQIICTNQKEFDAAIKNKDVEIIIKNTTEWVVVSQCYDNSTVRVFDNSTVTAYDNSTVTAYDNSTVRAYDNSTVRASGNSTVTAYDNSTVTASGNSTVTAYDNSTVTAYDNSTVRVFDNSTVTAYGNSTVRAYDNSTVRASGNSTVTAYDNSTVTASGNSTVTASDNSTVRVFDNSTVRAYGNSTVRVFDNTVTIEAALMYSVIIMIACVCQIKRKKKTVNIIKTKKADHYTKNEFTDIYPADKNGNVTLYKSVNPDTLCDFYTGKIKYHGVVTCPDWDGNKDLQCGNGLHLSPRPEMALNYNRGKLLVCEVNKKDFVVYPSDITKVRCRKVKVIGEYKT